jgi:integrase
MKTEESRKPIPLETGLSDVLTDWRRQCAYNQPEDYVFASMEMDGKQPLWPNSAMEKHIRPAALRAKITKRLGWHTLRHTFGTLINANGADLKTVQSLMRHANVSVTMDSLRTGSHASQTSRPARDCWLIVPICSRASTGQAGKSLKRWWALQDSNL